jgi:hypothetical protein
VQITKVSNDQMEDDLQHNMTSKSATTGHILLKLKIKLFGSNQSAHLQRYKIKMTSNGWRPPTEENLKIQKVEYFTDHWSDLTQIWNFSYWDQTRVHKGMKWRGPPMEDDLQRKMIVKYEKYNILTKEDDLKIWKVQLV